VENIRISYSWVKQALQGAGLVAKRRKRGPHRRRRPRRPLPGMLLHIDASKHRWFQDSRYYDLIVVLDNATTEIYYARRQFTLKNHRIRRVPVICLVSIPRKVMGSRHITSESRV